MKEQAWPTETVMDRELERLLNLMTLHSKFWHISATRKFMAMGFLMGALHFKLEYVSILLKDR